MEVLQIRSETIVVELDNSQDIIRDLEDVLDDWAQYEEVWKPV